MTRSIETFTVRDVHPPSVVSEVNTTVTSTAISVELGVRETW